MRRMFRIVAVLMAMLLLVTANTACNGGKKTTATGTTTKTTKKVTSATATKTITTLKATTAASTQGQGEGEINENQDQWPGSAEDTEIPEGTEALDETYKGLTRPKEEPVDLKGRTITIIVPSAIGYMIPEAGTTEVNEVKLARTAAAEQAFNCKIVWERFTGNFFNTLMANALAGTEWGDIITTYRTASTDLATLVENNVLYALDDYIDFTHPFYDQPHMRGTLYKGKHYGFRESAMMFSNMTAYNRDILEAAGCPDIFELQMNNAWTWDALAEICINTTRDLNGDGITDQWGLENANGLTTTLLESNGGDFMERDANGIYRVSMTNPKNIRAYTFYSDLCNVYKVVSPLSGQINNNWYKGAVAVCVGQANSANFNAKSPPNSVYAVFPMGPDTDKYHCLTYGGPMYAIPTNVNDPASIASLMKEMFSLWDLEDPNSIELSEALIGPFRPFYFCPEKDEETYKLYLKHMHMPTYASFYGIYLAITTPFFNEMKASNIPVATVVDKYASQAQAMLEDLLKYNN